MSNQKLVSYSLLFLLLASCASSRTSPRNDSPKSQNQTRPNAQKFDPNTSPADQALDSFTPPPPYASIPKTKYQIVQEGYDRAEFIGELNDFDILDEPSPKVFCLSTKGSDPNTMTEMVIKQMMVQVEGTPDRGPLFPGTLDRVERRLVIGKNNGWVNSQNLTNEKRLVFELTRNSEALVIAIIENKFGIYQDVGAPAEIWIKKNSNGLDFFKVYKVDSNLKRTEIFIGYCYHK